MTDRLRTLAYHGCTSVKATLLDNGSQLLGIASRWIKLDIGHLGDRINVRIANACDLQKRLLDDDRATALAGQAINRQCDTRDFSFVFHDT